MGVTDVHRLMSSRQLRNITTNNTPDTARPTNYYYDPPAGTLLTTIKYYIRSTLWHIIGTFIHQGASLRNKTNSPSETRTMYISLCDALETQ